MSLSKCESLPAINVADTEYPSPFPQDQPAGERIAFVQSTGKRELRNGRYYFPPSSFIAAHDLRDSNPTAHPTLWAAVPLLQRVLADRPTAARLHSEKYQYNRSTYPPANAAQQFHSHLHYIDAPWGSGYLVLTQYGQDRGSRVNNDELFCLFQGITKDNTHLLTGSFSVNHDKLPANFDADPPGTLETDVKKLDRLEATSFRPSLADLQKMAAAIQIKQTSP